MIAPQNRDVWHRWIEQKLTQVQVDTQRMRAMLPQVQHGVGPVDGGLVLPEGKTCDPSSPCGTRGSKVLILCPPAKALTFDGIASHYASIGVTADVEFTGEIEDYGLIVAALTGDPPWWSQLTDCWVGRIMVLADFPGTFGAYNSWAVSQVPTMGLGSGRTSGLGMYDVDVSGSEPLTAGMSALKVGSAEWVDNGSSLASQDGHSCMSHETQHCTSWVLSGDMNAWADSGGVSDSNNKQFLTNLYEVAI